MADNNTPKEIARQRKKDVIMKVKKLGEMTTLYKILTKIEERIRNNPWDKDYALKRQLSPYDMVLITLCVMSEARMRGYFTAWKRFIIRREKKTKIK